MAILSLAFKSLLNRKLTFFITLFSIAISVTLLLGVQNLKTETKNSFMKSITGTDLIIGARGSASQLLLSSVFHIGNTPNTIKFDSFEKISDLPAVQWAVPIAMGDSHKGYTVIGTNHDFFEHYQYADKQNLKVAKGKIDEDIFAVVIGADVAKKLHYHVGDKIIMTHGSGEFTGHGHDHDNIVFTISAILAPSFTSIDQSLIVSLESMHAMHLDHHDHIGALPNETTIAGHEHNEHDHAAQEHDEHDHAAHEHDEHESHDHEEHAAHDHQHKHEEHATHDHDDHAAYDHEEHEAHKHDEHAHAEHDHEEHAAHDHQHEHEHEHEHEEHVTHDHEEHAAHKHDEHAHAEHDHEEHAAHEHDEHDHAVHMHDDHDHAVQNYQESREQRMARQLMIKPEKLNAVFVGLTSPQAIIGLQSYINNYEAEPLSAIVPALTLQELWQFFSIAEVALNIVASFVVLVGLLGMVSIILMSLNERRREMAILRSVGAQPKHIFALIIGEAAAVCFTGIVIGIALLYALLFILQAPLANSFGFYLEINMLNYDDLIILLTIQFSAILIALLPATLSYQRTLSDGMNIKF